MATLTVTVIGCGRSKDASPVANLFGVWGSGPNDVWAVGAVDSADRATILHWNGSVWSPATIGTAGYLTDVWGSGPNDVWAVGGEGAFWEGLPGTILHWDGSVWSAVPSGATGTLFGVWGSGPSDAWAVGTHVDLAGPTFVGIILHWDGSSWSTVTPSGTGGFSDVASGGFSDVWGSGPNDVWAVGDDRDDGGIILRWNGSSWSVCRSCGTNGVSCAIPTNTISCNAGRIIAVWGRGASDAWIVGVEGNTRRWNGSEWSRVPSDTNQNLSGVWGSGPDDIWAVGDPGLTDGSGILHWNGSSWSFATAGSMDLALRGSDVWGSGPNDVWVVSFGNNGGSAIAHWDGSSWSARP